MAMRRSFGSGSVKASKPVNFNSSGGSNTLMNMMMAQSMLPQKETIKKEANLGEEAESLASGPGQVQELESGNAGFLKPGATFNRRGVSTPIVRDFSVEESKALSGSDALAEQIGYIYGEMDKPDFASKWIKATGRLGGGQKGEILGIPLSIGDSEAMKLSHAVQEMQNRLLYLRSGAQINENEFKRLSKALPSMTDISDYNDPTFSVLRKKLDDNLKDAMNIKGRLTEGGNYNSTYWEDQIPPEIKEQLQADYRKQQKAYEGLASAAPTDSTQGVGATPPPAQGNVGLAQSNLPGTAPAADPLDEFRKAFIT